MGNSQSDHSPAARITTSSQPFYNNKDRLNINVSNTPLNFNILKSITLVFLKTYSEENAFHHYHSGLKKFVEDYDFQRFSGFLGDFSDAVFDNTNSKESFLSTASNSPSAVDLQDQGLCIPFKAVQHGKFRPSIEINRHLFSNSLEKSRDLTDRVERFMQMETAKKTNFFFEFAQVFGELFAARYQNDLQSFEKACKDAKPKTIEQKQALKEDIKLKYEQARQEVRHFQNILVYTLRSFVVQAHSNLTQCTTLSVKKTFFERLGMKLLFGKNRIYSVYFDLIKYYVRDEEAALRKSINELKSLKLEGFKVDQKFCMKESATPYENVIECLNYMDVYTSPYDKFEAITHMNKEMTKEIRKNWEKSLDHGQEEACLELTAEKLIPINCYCLVQSGNVNMKRHQVFMDDFINQELMNFGDEAYYYIAFVASASFLINVAENPIRKLRQL